MAHALALLSFLQVAQAIAGFRTSKAERSFLYSNSSILHRGDNDTAEGEEVVYQSLLDQLAPNCEHCTDGADVECCNRRPSSDLKCSQYLPPAVFDTLISVDRQEIRTAVNSWHQGVKCFQDGNSATAECDRQDMADINCWCDPCRPLNTAVIGNSFADDDVLYCDETGYVEKCYPATPIHFRFRCNARDPANDPYGGWAMVRQASGGGYTTSGKEWVHTPEELWPCLGATNPDDIPDEMEAENETNSSSETPNAPLSLYSAGRQPTGCCQDTNNPRNSCEKMQSCGDSQANCEGTGQPSNPGCGGDWTHDERCVFPEHCQSDSECESMCGGTWNVEGYNPLLVSRAPLYLHQPATADY